MNQCLAHHIAYPTDRGMFCISLVSIAPYMYKLHFTLSLPLEIQEIYTIK